MLDMTMADFFGDKFTQEDMAKIEAHVKRPLPNDLKEFFIKYGGFAIVGNGEITHKNGYENPVDEFYGKFGPYDPLTVDGRILRIGEEDLEYPPDSLVIATNLFGNDYFGVWNDNVFEVRCMLYFDEANSFLVANSFTEFLERIVVTPYDDE